MAVAEAVEIKFIVLFDQIQSPHSCGLFYFFQTFILKPLLYPRGYRPCTIKHTTYVKHQNHSTRTHNNRIVIHPPYRNAIYQ